MINKIDLAPMVGASLAVMNRDALKMRGQRPFVFTQIKDTLGVDEVIATMLEMGGLPWRLTGASIGIAARNQLALGVEVVVA